MRRPRRCEERSEFVYELIWTVGDLEVAILVNQQGKRFVDEGEYPSDKTYAKFGKIDPLTQPGDVAYVVFDTRTREKTASRYAASAPC